MCLLSVGRCLYKPLPGLDDKTCLVNPSLSLLSMCGLYVLLILPLNVGTGVTCITGTVALVDSITADILLLLGGCPGGLGRDFGLLPLPCLGPLPVNMESCLGTLTS